MRQLWYPRLRVSENSVHHARSQVKTSERDVSLRGTHECAQNSEQATPRPRSSTKSSVSRPVNTKLTTRLVPGIWDYDLALAGGCPAVREVYLTEALSKLFCKSRFPHSSVNISFIITNIKNKLTDFWQESTFAKRPVKHFL